VYAAIRRPDWVYRRSWRHLASEGAAADASAALTSRSGNDRGFRGCLGIEILARSCSGVPK
jgi:hypothetical protein